MNAVAADFETPGDVKFLVPGRDRSWIDAALTAWGEWLWTNRDFEGYPTADPVHAFMNGAGGGSMGHRVLCKDPPNWFRLTHALYLLLPEHEKVAVFAEYVPGARDDGRVFTRAEKCQAVGISDEGFRKRLQRARFRIWEWSKQRQRRN